MTEKFSTLLAFSLLSTVLQPAVATDSRELTPMGKSVGELQKQWQFPSDHLPIGITVDQFHIASWNVLDSKYMKWVLDRDSQGLKSSMIGTEHVFVGDSKLTVRDQHIVDLILSMLLHPTHPKQIIALQECGDAFVQELFSRLPAGFFLIHQQNNVLIVEESFHPLQRIEVSGVFSDEPKRSLQSITLLEKHSGKVLRVVNVHIPGNPLKPSRYEFGQYLNDTQDPAILTIAMGDMNFNEQEMKETLSQNFSLYAPYCTNISPYTFYSKCIDHFIIHAPTSNVPIKIHQPEEVLLGLEPTVLLLLPTAPLL